MVIRIGDNPQGLAGINKFIAKSGDGMRGTLIALHSSGKKAIVLAMNTSIANDVEWGNQYLIEEKKPDQYPIVVRRVSSIPDSPGWKVIAVATPEAELRRLLK